MFGTCVPRSGITRFDGLVADVMARSPYNRARRVFWIMDNASIHRGQRCVDRFRRQRPTTQHGMKCQGCDRTFDDSRYLELDDNTPRADGGINHITNRILLCGPCNRVKSNIYTLLGLRRVNKERGLDGGNLNGPYGSGP